MSTRKTGNTLVHVPDAIKKSVKRLLLDLEDMEDLRCAGKPADLSAITAALWLWFGRMPLADARAFLASRFPELEAVLGPDAGAGADASPKTEATPSVSPSAPRKRRSKGAS